MLDTALLFSGGKDSLACLHLYREQWPNIYVVWVNTGAAYSSTIVEMEKWRKKLPHFVELKSDQPGNVAQFGWPSDIVPVHVSAEGVLAGYDPPFLVQSYMTCCAINIWTPTWRFVQEKKIKKLIRGQKLSDGRRGSLRHGSVAPGGVEILHPLEDWTDEKVWEYLAEVGAEVPSYYRVERTSRDCWNCTAYLDENVERLRNLPETNRQEVIRRLTLINDAVNEWRDFYGAASNIQPPA